MRWGIELWDSFDEVSTYVHKGIEFYEKYEEFCKKRCAIENSYAKNLRKLIESYEPKKKDSEENNTTYLKCFTKVLSELKDIAGQHELVSENVQDRIISKLTLIIKSLKEERRKCIDDKERYYAEHLACDELMEKSKVKYERAFKEVEKAKELLFKVENDDSASKNDIKKQKNICEQKERTCNMCQAEYGKQLIEANKIKSLYYREQLPNVLDTLQNLERKRIENFKDLVCESVNIEVEVMPRIQECYKEIESAAQTVSSDHDCELVITMYKTGYNIPGDHIFEDLNEKSSSQKTPLNGVIQTNGSINSFNGNSTQTLAPSSNSSTSTSRQKKYRTINRIKGLFTASGKNDNESLYDLPPQQLKKELIKKIDTIQADIEKQQKEREGLIKLKEIYSTNQKFGDSQSAAQALKINDDKLAYLTSQLKNYQDLLSQVELNNSQQNQQTIPYMEYSNSGSSGGTLPRNGKSHQTSVYQSPSQQSVNSSNNQNSSLPGTPLSHHSNSNNNTNNNNHQSSNETPNKVNHVSSNGIGAYAVSPVTQLNNRSAPIASVDRNESFDDEDEEDDGCYENPSAALRANINNSTYPSNVSVTTTITATNTTIVTSQQSPNNNNVNYADLQYDHVDSTVYDQNGQQYLTSDQEPIIGTALVMYSFSGTVQNAMSIQENESLNVLERDSGDGWTLVKRLNGEKGYVPTDYIRIVYY